MNNYLFHRVYPGRDQLWDPMDPVLFEKCIKHIKKKFEVVLLEDYLSSGDFSNHSSIATIQFDDGYLDNYDYALPILEKYQVKASFYIVTDCIDQNVPTWTHVLEHAFQETKMNELTLSFDFLPEQWRTQKWTEREERLSFVKSFKPYLKKVNHEQRKEVLAAISAQLHDVTLPQLMMNWDQLRHLKYQGHYIGSHTVTHAMLGTIQDEQVVKRELVQSAERIKTELGYFPKTISYPVGSYNELTKELAASFGYDFGLAVHQDQHDLNAHNLYEIKRIELYNEPWWKTKLRINNSLEKVKKIIRYR